MSLKFSLERTRLPANIVFWHAGVSYFVFCAAVKSTP
jgi:hypothetical protein